MTKPMNSETIDELILLYLDAQIGRDDFQVLCRAMREDPAVLDRFTELSMLDRSIRDSLRHGQQLDSVNQARLRSEQTGERFGDLLAQLDPANAAEALAQLARLHDEGLNQPLSLEVHRRTNGHSKDIGPSRRVKIKARLILGGSIAALIAFAGVVGLLLSSLSQPSPQVVEQPAEATAVATLTDERDAVWQAGSGTLLPGVGDTLQSGTTLELTEGFAEITTLRGAVAILEAPATIELIDNDNALYLHAGKLVGLCHTESSKGFVVRADTATIVDLGTEFGVTADADGVQATVFVGQVTVKTPNGLPQVVNPTQTARVSNKNDEPTLVVEDKVIEGFARRLPREPLVTSAFINDDRFRVEVAPQAFYEDAKVHTDREHEVNGIDAAGLPAELLGADIVLTPGNARPGIVNDTEGLQIEIQTSRPAQVYLLFRGGAELPAWVGRDYVPTNMRVGLDFGKSSQSSQASLGIGPGISIDSGQRVWRRKKPVEGRALVAEQMTMGTAYVILALPADASP